MHQPTLPVDKFEAFRELIDNSSTAVDVAARFDVSEATFIWRTSLAAYRPFSSMPTATSASGCNRCSLKRSATTIPRRIGVWVMM
jgi:hypothetical protein